MQKDRKGEDGDGLRLLLLYIKKNLVSVLPCCALPTGFSIECVYGQIAVALTQLYMATVQAIKQRTLHACGFPPA